jgi:hypothetical protein
MPYRSRRRESGIGRGGIIALLVGVIIVAGAFWIGPFRAAPAELRLLALANAEFSDTLRALTLPPDTFSARAGAVARAPIVLGVQNVGARAVQPTVLRLTIPGRYRLTGASGEQLPFRRTGGTPLIQYVFEMEFPELPARGEPLLLPQLDTLWLEPILPEYDCTLIGDSVPDFLAAPVFDAQTLAHVPIFYSFDAEDSDARQSGLLTVLLDAEMLQQQGAGAPARGQMQVFAEGAPRPDLGPLTQAGTRTAWCGDPELPIEVRTILYEGFGGARMYELQVGGRARKLLYDTNRDGIVELELWDAEGDGAFRFSREAAYEVPSFVRPLPIRVAGARYDEVLEAGEMMPVDSMWLAQFNDPGQGPFRFAAAAETPELARVDPASPPPPPAPVDSTWLQRFHDADLGPFRFSQRPPPPPADTVATAPPDTTPAAPPPPRRPRLLGQPVPTPPPGGR